MGSGEGISILFKLICLIAVLKGVSIILIPIEFIIAAFEDA